MDVVTTDRHPHGETEVSVDVASGGALHGVVVEVEGQAYPTGEHRFTLDLADPLDEGFVLR